MMLMWSISFFQGFNFITFGKTGNIKIIAEDFTSISVDPIIGAIVSRGSAKLEQQIKMTHHWREQGSKLYSIQTAKSLAEQAESLTSIQSTQLAIDGDLELVLLQVL